VALKAHELVKVRVFDDDRTAREGLMTRICAELGCAAVQHIGKLLVIWRENEKPAPVKAAKRAPRTAGDAPPARRRTATAQGETPSSSRRRRAGSRDAPDARTSAASAPPPRARGRSGRGATSAGPAVPTGPHAPSRRRRRTGGS